MAPLSEISDLPAPAGPFIPRMTDFSVCTLTGSKPTGRYPMRFFAASAEGNPSTDNNLESGNRIDRIGLIAVVLPAPLGPMRPQIWPRDSQDEAPVRILRNLLNQFDEPLVLGCQPH